MTVDPIKNKKDIELIKELFLYRKEYRNYLLFCTGINTFLRISDLVRLTVSDVYDLERKTIESEISLTDKKTEKTFRIPINNSLIKALNIFFTNQDTRLLTPEKFLFHNGRNGNKAISEKTGWQIIKQACFDLGISGNFGSHTMRKTKARQFYDNSKDKSEALVILMKTLKHRDIQTTLRYIGLEKEITDKVYLFEL
jgi:integrase